jgi:predicted O-linked N-acetylglucosamine transferase (SPINDLY family)
MGKLDEALTAFENAVAMAPDRPEPRMGVSNVLREKRRYVEALDQLQVARNRNPGHTGIESALATVLWTVGRTRECVTLCRESLGRSPGNKALLNTLANALNYVPGASNEETLAAHRAFGDALMSRSPPMPRFANSRDPERTLKVGLLSNDFRRHSVAYFIEPLLEHLSRSRTRVLCYSTTTHPDAVTQRLRARADGWRDVASLSPASLAAGIRSDAVDILIETSGLTARHRLDAVALGCAPVQVTFCGYPNTTGLSRVHARWVDSITDPTGAERWSVEPLARLDPCFLCYRPPEEQPGDTAPEREGRGPMVFGSFNATYKLNHELFTLWARVLNSTPGSVLAIKTFELSDPRMKADLSSRLSSAGIASNRFRLLDPAPSFADHLLAYRSVDVALDTFPYAGTTTTLEALWMGVPVVTLAGRAHAGRVGASLLSAIGAPQWIAREEAEYIQKAAALAADATTLAETRRSLRQRVRTSIVCDGPLFAERMERSLRDMWRRWCASGD